ncbi:hypothetical protein M0R04_16355 [Candidatus Dojkabacteria bacterium]|jgi:uncharacterized coiled-coil DUF342 family protein|nr:hypothetical protein [Candidatus Dojkabacteria bacterium]
MNYNEEILKLKARAYDLMAIIENIQKEMKNVNGQIAQLSMERDRVSKTEQEQKNIHKEEIVKKVEKNN